MISVPCKHPIRVFESPVNAVVMSASVCRLYLEQEVSLPDDVVRKYSDVALGRLNTAINELRRLFLVEDLVDSLKVRLSNHLHRSHARKDVHIWS